MAKNDIFSPLRNSNVSALVKDSGATYNNFGKRKDTDPLNLIGYYNFKAYAYIDGVKRCLRIAIQILKDGSFYYNLDVNKLK